MHNHKSPVRSWFAFFFAVTIAISVVVLAPASQASSATVPNRITQAIDETHLATMSRNTRPEANAQNDRGALPDGYDVEHILLVLQRSPQQEAALEKFIDSLNDKNSPNFHKWLTAEQFGEQYGVSDDDIKTVTDWLQSHGLRINTVYANHMMIDFSGVASQVKEAFHTELHALEVNGQTHLSNMNDPQIPAALSPVVKGIFSLNDFRPHPMYKRVPDFTQSTQCGTRGTQPNPCYDMTPQDNQTIYGLNPLYAAGISGQGQTIVLVEDTDTYGATNYASDWNTYRSTFGLSTAFPAGNYTEAHPGGCTDPGTNADDGEAAIDVEVASAIAPSANIELISCPSGTVTFGGLIAMQNLFNGAGPYPGIVSVSYGVCEAFNGNGGNQAFFNTYQQAAAEGISVFGASGDEGPSSCSADFSIGSEYDVASLGVSGWTDSPYNVSVGGTDFEDTYNVKEAGASFSTYWSATNTSGYGSALQYVPEIPWNDACGSALIAEYINGSFTTYGTTGFCNNSKGDTTSTYLIAGAGSGGASNCATGAGGTTTGENGISQPECQGWAKPSWQTAYGVPSDGVRDIPDVSMFAANGIWGHYEVVCWSDPTQTSGGAATCTAGSPQSWSGFGGTSIASPTMAAVQALVNQKTGQMWGNPNPYYYQIAQGEYGAQGGSFLGSSCNASGSGGPASGCVFNDVTQGDIDLACENNSTTEEAHCYKPSGTRGVDSTNNVTGATVINGGSNYTSAPTCTIAGPTNNQPYKTPTGTTLWAGGSQAACTATVSSSTTTAVWTISMASTSGVGNTIILTNPSGSVTCGPYTLSGTSTTLMASNLVASIGSGCSLATATSSTSTVTITASAAGYAGDFITEFGPATEFDAFYVYITNSTKGQGPNYVSGITITTAGSGYQPETPITLTGVGSGAVAVANTTPGTASQSYQPAYGAAPGFDMATGLGSINAYNLVCSSVWGSGCSSFTLTANPTSGSAAQGSSTTSTITVVPAGGFNGSVTLSAASLPTGVTASFSPNPATSTSTMTLTVGGGAAVGGPSAITINGVSGSANSSTTYGLTVTAGTPGIYSPVNGSTLTGNSATFQWVGEAGATAYWLDVGKEPGGNEYEQSGSLSSSTYSVTVNSLPSDGSTVYATWYYFLGGGWQSIPYSYTAFGGGGVKGVITSPTPGSMLTGTSVPFTWSLGSGATAYWIDAGNVAGGNQYYQSGNLGNVSGTTVSNLPTDGSTVYVTLYSLVSGQWLGNAYTYTAYSLSAAAGVLTTPNPGSTLTSGTVTFGWTPGAGASAYWLDVGNVAGGNQYYQSGNLGNVTSTTVSGLPTDGSTIYVTLYSLVGSQWVGNQYSYTALNASGGLAAITSPSNGSTLSGNSVTFTWSTDPNATAYWLDIGTTPGGNTIYQSGNLGNVNNTTVNSLPADGSTIYATLYSYVGGQWLSTSASYTSGP